MSWLVAVLTVTYTGAVVALILWAQSIAPPTRGGIQPSEVLEGTVRGGLDTLLAVWVVLLVATAAAWVTGVAWVAHRRSRYYGRAHEKRGAARPPLRP